jgi:hypothetical protein
VPQDGLVGRYAALDKPMAIRKRRLLDSLQAQQLFRDLDDEAAWIREKEPIIASTNRGINQLTTITICQVLIVISPASFVLAQLTLLFIVNCWYKLL